MICFVAGRFSGLSESELWLDDLREDSIIVSFAIIFDEKSLVGKFCLTGKFYYQFHSLLQLQSLFQQF
jgi:hypothetical protein